MKSKSKNNLLIAVCVVVGLYLVYKLIALIFVGTTMTFGTPVDDKKLYATPDECISAAIDNELTFQNYNLTANSLYVYESENYYYQFYLAADNHTTSCFVLGKQEKDNSTKYFYESLNTPIENNHYEWQTIGDCYYRIAENEDEIVNYNEVEPQVTEFTIDTVYGKETLYLLFAIQ